MGRTQKLWDQYKKRQNMVTKLKTKSINEYFDKKCNKNSTNNNGKEFWNAVKPFISSKMRGNDSCFTILDENDKLISKPIDVCESFNNFFSNVANDIGLKDTLSDFDSMDAINDYYKDHRSIKLIQNHHDNSRSFHFSHVTENKISELINSLDTGKSTGYDNIPSKLVKIAGDHLSRPFSYMINLSLSKSIFPTQLKRAEVSPLYKAKDALQRGNFRPVSILSCISKLFERSYFNDLYVYFNEILSVFIAAFRRKYGCQHVLTRLLDDCKSALDKMENVGLVIMDLSKAFDCIPHSLLLAKLSSYGLSSNACNLIWSYLDRRMQRVKIGDSRSQWQFLHKGVPQGSILGPLLFNIFTNDLFLEFGNTCNLYNFADDNTIGSWNPNPLLVKCELESNSANALSWFSDNGMSANASKLNALLFKFGNRRDEIKLSVNGSNITLSNHAKMLGVTFDDKLSFDVHVDNMCKKASRQISAISRISKYLSTDCLIKMYNAFVRSNFLYCANVWHFGINGNFWKIEKVNKRALRVVFNDYTSSYPELLLKAKRNCIYIQNLHVILTECYKYVNAINPNILKHVFKFRNHDHDTRGIQMVQLPQVNTITHGVNSFRFQGPRLWNLLPDDIKLSECEATFKFNIRNWKPTCHCGSCIICKLHLV